MAHGSGEQAGKAAVVVGGCVGTVEGVALGVLGEHPAKASADTHIPTTVRFLMAGILSPNSPQQSYVDCASPGISASFDFTGGFQKT
jgi:hypothetical protein